jgi:hypothetical protein
MFRVRYELGFYTSDCILHSHRRKDLKSHIALTGLLCSGDVICFMWFYIPEDVILHSPRHEYPKICFM